MQFVAVDAPVSHGATNSEFRSNKVAVTDSLWITTTCDCKKNHMIYFVGICIDP